VKYPNQNKPLVVVRGAGDLASGVAYRLFKCGLDVLMTEISQPLVVRRTVSFARAVWEGSANIEGVEARLAETVEHALELLKNRIIPVLVDPEALVIKQLRPTIVVDARIAKRNLGTTINDAPLVIGLGPGFTAGVDVDAVIETCRGHRLGRVIYSGGAIPDTGCPGSIDGHTWGRLLKAPVDGTMRPCRERSGCNRKAG
jgi:xanthine dehydrogenase accessory factor